MILTQIFFFRVSVIASTTQYNVNNFFRLDYAPEAGTYKLIIKSTSYEKDHGQFECKVKETGTGRVLHSRVFTVTVLLLPGSPIITPNHPVAMEGDELSLTCASTGGSPDPHIK